MNRFDSRSRAFASGIGIGALFFAVLTVALPNPFRVHAAAVAKAASESGAAAAGAGVAALLSPTAANIGLGMSHQMMSLRASVKVVDKGSASISARIPRRSLPYKPSNLRRRAMGDESVMPGVLLE
jgi:hypothetical protein